MQVLTRGMSDQTMRIKSMKLENKELRQQLTDNAALWRDLQHDLVTLNGIPEGKGRRQVVSRMQMGCFMLSSFTVMHTLDKNLLMNVTWTGGVMLIPTCEDWM